MNSEYIVQAIRRKYPGAAIVPEISVIDEYRDSEEAHMRRIDLLMSESLQRTAIEIKVSVPDLKRETWAKTRMWRKLCHRFVYAVPAGLCENPPFYGSGLWWVHDNGRIEIRRKAVINKYPEPFPQDLVQRLMYRAT